jgi:hypothetical protein
MVVSRTTMSWAARITKSSNDGPRRSCEGAGWEGQALSGRVPTRVLEGIDIDLSAGTL